MSLKDKLAFVPFAIEKLRSVVPNSAIQHVSGYTVLVDGRRLDLENLHRMVLHELPRATSIVEHYFEQLFGGSSPNIFVSSFDEIRERIMPRIQPVTIFKHLSREQVAHVPFVQGTVIVFVVDWPQMTVSLTSEQLHSWRVTAEEVEEIARGNLEKHAPSIEWQTVESKEGGRAAIITEHDGYDAARILLPEFHEMLSEELGGDFLVGIPARDLIVAYRGPRPFYERLAGRIKHDFGRLPYPISPHPFLVTRDGVAGTARVEEEEAEEAA